MGDAWEHNPVFSWIAGPRRRVRLCFHQWRWLALLAALALARGALYAVIVPPWQSPDETGHFEYVWLLAHLRRVPAWEDASPGFEGQLIDSLYRWRFGNYTARTLPEERPERLQELPRSIHAQRVRTFPGRFSLAYAVQALATVPLLHKGLEAQLYAVRLSSVLLNGWIVAAAYLTFRVLFPERELVAILAAAIVLLNPQHTFINATGGDGTLAEAGAALVIYGWARAFGRRFGALEAVAIAAGTVIANLSKNSAVFLIPADALLALWWLGRRLWHGWRWWQAAALVAALLLLASGLWIWRDTALGERAQRWVEGLPGPEEWAWVDANGRTFAQALWISHDTFWGNFGWLNLPLSSRWYGGIAGVSLLALLGWTGWAVGSGRVPAPRSHVPTACRELVEGSPQPALGLSKDFHAPRPTPHAVRAALRTRPPTNRAKPVGHVSNVTPSSVPTTSRGAAGEPAARAPRWGPAMMLVLLIAAFGVYAWVALLGRAGGSYQFQGRYLFPAIVPWAYFLAGGAVRLVDGRRGAIYLLLAGLAVLDAWAMGMYILPYYYG